MKRFVAFVSLALFAALGAAQTKTPIQLLSPTGSTSGQAIISTGASTAPAWATIAVGSLAPISGNTFLGNTANAAAVPAAFGLPSCSAPGSLLQYTSGTGFGCGTGYAGLNSPALTGTPTAPTAAAGTSTTQIATTAFLTQPGPIGSATANTGRFTTLQATGAITPSSTAGIVGTATNDNANAGSVGEFISAQGLTVSLTNSTAANITSISLTAGDWQLQGNIEYVPAGGTTMTQAVSSSNTTSATLAAAPARAVGNFTSAAGTGQSHIIPTTRISIASTTTVYLVGFAAFGGGTLTASGFISARRVR